MQQKDVYSISKTYLEQKNEDFWRKDVKILQDIMKIHSELYYEKEAPIISDNEYDILFEKLSVLEEKFWVEVKLSDSVWSEGKRSSFKKVSHTRPMISLGNTYNEEDLQDFDVRVKRILKTKFSQDSSLNSLLPGEKKQHLSLFPLAGERIQDRAAQGEENNIPYTVEYKFDGLWVELVYKNWKLTQAITRWNGIEWEDVTENIKQIKNIPHEIRYLENIEIRGEVLMPLSSFERLNTQAKEAGEKIFANPRNAASGSLRILDTTITAKRDLKFFAYDISDFESYGEKSYFSMVHSLEKLGFDISSYFQKHQGISEIIQEIQNFGEKKKEIDFEIDGLVIKVDTIDLWKDIWYTEHHPRYAIAYKFPAEIQTTKIESVEHSVGRTGTITPVANVTPINLWWAVIRRSTLHNYEEIEKLDVREWDTVFIKRAGEVIPKIISVVKELRDGTEQKIAVPQKCPSCSSEVFKDEDKVRYYCNNKVSCTAQNKEQLAYSVGKGGFNIDGLWERQVEIFLTEWLIVNLVDIFQLKNKREKILELEGFKELSVNNLLSAIEKVQKTDIATFLRSIGIPGVGKKTAKTLSQIFHSESDIWNFTVTEEELIELPDIGPEVAKSVVEFFMTQREYILSLLKVLEIKFPDTKEHVSGKYSWKKICITGSFDGYSRDDLIEILEKQWGEFVWSVSKNTDYLLAWDKAGGKLKKAWELWIEVLKLEVFLSN